MAACAKGAGRIKSVQNARASVLGAECGAWACIIRSEKCMKQKDGASECCATHVLTLAHAHMTVHSKQNVEDVRPDTEVCIAGVRDT
eukprot:1157849-Pelagomonas_calceolata.AAC.10